MSDKQFNTNDTVTAYDIINKSSKIHLRCYHLAYRLQWGIGVLMQKDVDDVKEQLKVAKEEKRKFLSQKFKVLEETND